MRAVGDNLVKIEMIRTELLTKKAGPEAFKELDSWHKNELKYLKIFRRHFIIGIILTLLQFCLGILNGVLCLRNWGENEWVTILNMLVCIFLLETVRREIVG